MKYAYLFGPVLSGRIGLSLGLDLLGSPVCSMDCVYCEVGATTDLTLTRKPYVPAANILAELRHWAEHGGKAEIVTLGGSGEPTLNTEMGAVIAGVREILPGLPVAVLTNSTLMPDPEVRRELANADVVLPSLDTLIEREFRKLNRCHTGVSIQEIAEGLLTFRKEFHGKLYLEVLLAGGINDTDENLAALKTYVTRLAPDRVDVTTLSRPGTLDSAKPVNADTLKRFRRELGTGIERSRKATIAKKSVQSAEAIDLLLASLARRPQTVLQLSGGLGLDESTARDALEHLLKDGRVTMREQLGQTFYSVPEHTS